MSSSNGNKICENCSTDEDGCVYIHTMCQVCKDKHDEALFQQPPLGEECPICFLTIPSLITGKKYNSCCGKIICSGCIHAVQMMDDEAKCPFCRVPTPELDDEIVEMMKKRTNENVEDAKAIRNLGCYYYEGIYGMPQDYTKALELFHRAGELDCASANNNIGNAYLRGDGVERDLKQAKHYWELAAIGGNVAARYNLGCLEEDAGNTSISLKHFMIAAGCGHDLSLKVVRELYMNGHATKDDYANALRAYQKYIDGIKSPQRDEAAAFDSEQYRYY